MNALRKKIESGIRIIEIQIQTEEDIVDIINSTILEESATIHLYNFKRATSSTNNLANPIQKYTLYSSLKSHVEKDKFTCKNYDINRKGIYEISIPYDECIPYFINSGGLYIIGKVKAYLEGYLKKDCYLCKWQAAEMNNEKFCKLYKKCGNPKYCRENDARTCSMFKVNEELINYAIDDLNEYSSQAPIDIWKKESDSK